MSRIFAPPPAALAWREILRGEASQLSEAHCLPGKLTEWTAMKRRLRAGIQRSVGFVRPRGDLEIVEHGKIPRPGYVLKKLSFLSGPDSRVTAHLFIPDGPGPFPAILNVHGHWLEGKAAPEVVARCQAMVLAGFVVLSLDAIGGGERGSQRNIFEPHGDQRGAAILTVGETLLGLQIQDNMCGVDLLRSLKFVDKSRIGVTGASGGGNQTLWVAAMDPRIAAAVPVVSAGTFEAYVTNGNCWCETLPDGLLLGEEWGVLGLIAPRPLLILSATEEDITAFLPRYARQTAAAAREIYRLQKATDRFAFRLVPGPHGYFPEMRRHMLGWFKKWLQSKGDGRPASLPATEPLPENESLCFGRTPRPKTFPTLISHLSLATQRAKEGSHAFPPKKPAILRRRLREILRVRPTKETPVLRFKKASGTAAFHEFSVRSEGGVPLPGRIMPAALHPPADIDIVLHPGGREAGWQMESARLQREGGRTMCTADVRDIGELCWEHPDERNQRHPARASLWVGRTMMGNWTSDIVALAAALRAEFQGGRLHLIASGVLGLPSLAAAVLAGGFATVTVKDLPATFVVNGAPPTYPHGIFVPGFLRWGDVSMLAALCPCPLTVHSLIAPEGKKLSPRKESDWRKEVAALRNHFTKSSL